jgi:cobalamin biosynthetic protein CobC
MTAIDHGGRLRAAQRRWPNAPRPWIDLSTGINPVPYPMPALEPADLTRLPEPEDEQRLVAAAAACYGVADPAMVVAAPGTQILISLLPHLAPAPDVAVLGPTYAEHAAAWSASGAAVTAVEDLDAAGAAHSVVLCQPNNPDGRRHDPQRLLEIASRCARRGGVLVVDEAFADLEPPGLSVAGALPHPGLVVLRSFGKTYGLAGLRLGFLLTMPSRAARIRQALGPWAVSGPALRVGTLALADAPWRAAAAARLEAGSARLDALLRAAGLTVCGGTRLFRLAETPDAAGWHDRLGQAGVLVRRFADQPRRLRFGLPDGAAAWERLEAVLTVGT